MPNPDGVTAGHLGLPPAPQRKKREIVIMEVECKSHFASAIRDGVADGTFELAQRFVTEEAYDTTIKAVNQKAFTIGVTYGQIKGFLLGVMSTTMVFLLIYIVLHSR